MSEVELTLQQILNSKIYRDGARLAMWISPILFAGCGWLLNDIRTNTVDAVAIIKSDVAAVIDTQGDRAKATDQNFANLTGDLQDVAGAVQSVQVDLGSLKLGVAEMKGILTEMQRRDLATAWRAPLPMSERP